MDKLINPISGRRRRDLVLFIVAQCTVAVDRGAACCAADVKGLHICIYIIQLVPKVNGGKSKTKATATVRRGTCSV